MYKLLLLSLPLISLPPLYKLRNVFKICSVSQRLKILSSLEIFLVESSQFLKSESYTIFIFLLLLSLDDEYSIIKEKSFQIWNRIKHKSVNDGQYTVLRSSLMTSFTSILGKKDIENKSNSDTNSNMESVKNVNDIVKSQSNVNNNNNNNNSNSNILSVKSFRDYYNGNNENGLQDLLRLFQGLGCALGKQITCVQ